MKQITVNFGLDYDEQNQDVKERLCKQDFYEIRNLMIFKKNLKEYRASRAEVPSDKSVAPTCQPIDAKAVCNMIDGWSKDLHNRSIEGMNDWLAQISALDDTSNLEIKYFNANSHREISLRCGNFPKTQILDFVKSVYDKKGYVSEIIER